MCGGIQAKELLRRGVLCPLRLGRRFKAAAAALAAAPDWEGGTRIASALGQFNRQWARRVLARPGMVLLFSDGLERAYVDKLRFEAARLRRSCKRLVLLNPLLR